MAVEIRGTENRLATPSHIAMEALFRLKDHLVLPKIANRTFEEYFEGKIGDTITVKRPYRAKVTTGHVMKESAMIDKTVDVKVDQRFHFALQYSDTNETLDLVDFGARYMDAGAEELAYQFDIAGAEELAYALFYMDGTAGTALSLSSAQFIRAHATKVAIPRVRQNFALLDPLDIAEVSEDIQSVDMPELVGQNIRDTYKGRLAGWGVMESVHIPYLEVAAVPTAASPLTNGANQRGSSIITDGWGTSAATKVLNKGQLIQIAGVHEIQPRGDRRRTGNLATFVVTEDVTATAAGAATIKVYPEVNVGGSADTVANPTGKDLDNAADATLDASAFQTVSVASTATGIPDNSAITVVGRQTGSGVPAAGRAATFRQGLWTCGDALEYVNVTLTEFKSAVMAGTQTDAETGVSISYLADFEIKNRSERERLDILFGVKTVYPEIGIRHVGKKVS